MRFDSEVIRLHSKNSISHILAFLLSFILIVPVCIKLFLMLFPKIAASFETFTDIIIETPALTGTNKSGELTLFWSILSFGVVLFFICVILLRKYNFVKLNKYITSNPLFAHLASLFPPYVLLFILPNLCHFFFYKKCSLPLLFGTILMLAAWFLLKEAYKEYLILTIIIYYGIVSLFTLLCQFTDKGIVTNQTLYLLTGGTSVVILIGSLLFKSYAKTVLSRSLLLIQCLLPLLLGIYFIDDYLYKGRLIHIPYASGYYIFFGLLFCISMILFIVHAKRNWNNAAALPLTKLVCVMAPMLLFVYNSWSAAPMYAQPDQHHHGEQMIPWQQIITLGQTPYDEYTPVSGLFPMTIGAIQHLLLGGTASDYSPAVTILMVLCCLVTMYLLCRHTGNAWGLVFAVFFALPAYNRQYLVLPGLLLLTLPALVKKRSLWLAVYVFVSFLSGLYYPLFGAALLLGMLPLGLWQLYSLIKSKDWKADMKTPVFYISWLTCLIPIIISLPLLLKMLNHTLIYSSQTILADGIVLGGQSAPDNFLPFIHNAVLKNTCYISLRFFLPLLGVWIFTYLLFYYFKKAAPLFLFAMAAGGITLCISYTYTLVRADYGMLLSRSAPILISIAGIFLPVILLSLGKGLPSHFKGILMSLCFCLPLLLYSKVEDMKFPNMWIYPNGEADLIMDDESKLFSSYEVPALLLQTDELDIPNVSKEMLGDGFMVADQSHYLREYNAVIDKCNAVSNDTSYVYMDGQGFYYYTNTSACGTGFLQAAKGYEAQKELLSIISRRRPVFFSFDSVSNYYIYTWLLTNDYVYKASDGAFYPRELYTLLYNTEAADDIRDFYNTSFTGIDLEMAPASLGNSLSTLAPLFIDSLKLNDDLILSQPLDGMQYDFLSFTLKAADGKEIPSDALVAVSFETAGNGILNKNNSRICYQTGYYGKTGTFLFPIGMNPNWLLGSISKIQIRVLIQDMEVNYILTDCSLLKLRQ